MRTWSALPHPSDLASNTEPPPPPSCTRRLHNYFPAPQLLHRNVQQFRAGLLEADRSKLLLPGVGALFFFFFFFFTLVTGPRRSLSLKLSDTRVYEPQVRARLGTTPLGCARGQAAPDQQAPTSSTSLVR